MGGRPPNLPRLQSCQSLLVVRDGGNHRHHSHPQARLPRRRAQIPDCYAFPGSLHEKLTAELGRFPLFQYWGPGASIASSEWVAAAAEKVLLEEDPDLTLVYLPHLDYDLQRFGPDSPQPVAAAREIDRVAGRLSDFALERDRTVVVLSEYGITAAPAAT
jgi:predicted AlkP superfamily pyrophosphatase or phosphodiesterase